MLTVNTFEQRERHRFIERTIEETHDALSLPEVSSKLAPFQGRFDEIRANLFVPNIREGRLVLPPRDMEGTNKIPIVALNPGETVMIPPVMNQPMPAQLGTISQAIAGLMGQPGNFASRLSTHQCIQYSYPPAEVSLPFTLDPRHGAVTRVMSGEISMDERRFGGGVVEREMPCRPAIILSMQSDGKQVSHLPAPVLAHEEIHAWQDIYLVPYKESKPTNPALYELMAYHASAMVTFGQLESHGLLNLERPEVKNRALKLVGMVGYLSLQVESERIRYNDKADFEPKPELSAYLNRRGLMH